MAKDRKKVTISDIAKLAGVSVASVSRVLAGSDYPVRREVRERILEIAKELDYKPNPFGQMIRKGVHSEIGIIVPSITNPFYAQLLAAAELECLKRGYIPFICSSMSDMQLEISHLDILENKGVAGIILSSVNTGEAYINRLNALRIPLLLFDQNLDGFNGDCIRFDFYRGAYLSTEYLIKCGHRDIVFVSGPLDRGSRCWMYEGYKQALKDNNMVLGRKKLVSAVSAGKPHGEGDYQLGRVLGKLLLEREYLPDAVVTINDMTAIGLINYMHQEGIQVPHDLSVIGFDDISICEMVTPALTTIHQPAQETGTMAARVLIDRIENKLEDTVQIMMDPTLVERSSVRKIHKKIRR